MKDSKFYTYKTKKNNSNSPFIPPRIYDRAETNENITNLTQTLKQL